MDPPSFKGPEEKWSLRSAVMGSSRKFGSIIKEGKGGFQKAASSLCHKSIRLHSPASTVLFSCEFALGENS